MIVPFLSLSEVVLSQFAQISFKNGVNSLFAFKNQIKDLIAIFAESEESSRCLFIVQYLEMYSSLRF